MTYYYDFDPTTPLPHKDAFYPHKGSYFNAGVQHPISRGSVKAAEKYLEYKGFHTDSDFDPLKIRREVIEQFATLINAETHEITFVQSTTVGENLIIQALDLLNGGGRIVTDDLHYFGSYQTFAELKKRGVDVVTIRNKEGRIDLDDYRKAVTEDTTLVAVSGVSTFNGFQHDLKALSDIAHAKGALLYADVIHQVGATPLDVKECGVDFCSAGAFKWLMADQGLGFLYVRKESLKYLKRPWFGKRQVRNLVTHVFPGDDITTDEQICEYDLEESTEGYFAVWSEPRIIISQLHYSLWYILKVDVERITEYRQPMLKKLQEEIPKLGFKSLTPKGSITPLLAFECEDALTRLMPVLQEVDIQASVYKGHFRIALSVYTDWNDVERLLEALKRVR